MKINNNNLCVVGDIHGEFREIVWKITSLEIKDTAFIVAGDFGLGFHKRGYYDNEYQKIKSRLEKNGNCLLGIRGNHDNPEYFDPGNENFLDLPLFKAIPDYSRLTWGEHEILVIGGATSVDQEYRKKEKSIIWWEGERPVRDLGKLKGKEDIIISHEAPLCIGPVPSRPDGVALEIYLNILEDRRYLDTVLKETNPDKYYFGHYHQSTSGGWKDTLWRGLDINEIIEIRP